MRALDAGPHLAEIKGTLRVVPFPRQFVRRRNRLPISIVDGGSFSAQRVHYLLLTFTNLLFYIYKNAPLSQQKFVLKEVRQYQHFGTKYYVLHLDAFTYTQMRISLKT